MQTDSEIKLYAIFKLLHERRFSECEKLQTIL